MKVLLTGGNGFLGKTIHKELIDHGHEVQILGRSEECNIVCDLSSLIPELGAYDMVIHCAGLAHKLPRTDVDVDAFYRVNALGTNNLLKGIVANPKIIVLVSSVAVYGCDSGEMISETANLDGKSPYALSKIAAENLVNKWALKRGVKYLILRLPLIYGDNPPGNLAAMRKAMKKRRYFRIGKGNARKSWVQATEVAEFILNNPDLEGTYNLTSAHHPTLAEIENQIAREFNLPEPKSIPYGIAWLVANTFGRIPGFPLSLKRFRKLTTDLTYTSIHLKGGNGF